MPWRGNHPPHSLAHPPGWPTVQLQNFKSGSDRFCSRLVKSGRHFSGQSDVGKPETEGSSRHIHEGNDLSVKKMPRRAMGVPQCDLLLFVGGLRLHALPRIAQRLRGCRPRRPFRGFVARSYCSSICLASRRCCAFGSSWECAEEIANKPIIIAGTAIFLIVTLPKATRKAGLGVPPTPGLRSL